MNSASDRRNVLAAACLASCLALGLAAPATADFEPAPPRSLSVTKPAAGEIWHQGEARTISWVRGGPGKSATVRIWLKRLASDDPLRMIAATAPNSGAHAWTLPADVLDGSYVVRVEEPGAGALWDDSGMFTIRKKRLLEAVAPGRRLPKPAPAPPCTVSVSKPSYNQTCRLGGACTVVWDTADLQGYATVFLHVRQIDSQHPSGLEGGGFPVANSGTYPWVVPENFGPVEGSVYQIRLVTADQRCEGISAFFNVAPRRVLPRPGTAVPRP